MNELQMLTQEEVAELLHANIMTVSMLRELEVIRATKTGRNYMFAQDEIRRFQREYSGLDVSNKVHALKSKEVVENKNKLTERSLR